MTELAKLINPRVLQHLTAPEQDYLTDVFTQFGGYPKLEQLWQLIDKPWVEYGCDPMNLDERTTKFYRHPVWMLNGLFIEQDAQSLANRRMFTDWVVQQRPMRIADFGGGFGGLPRFIGQALPSSQVEVIEPYPHPAAIATAADTPNVRFVPALVGEYDMLIATDVFEHVSDPIGLVTDTASHLKRGGVFLIANCFQPVIKCHLPQLFYFEIAWDPAMKALGLLPGESVSYGRAYYRKNEFNVTAARKVAECMRFKLYPLVQRLPRGRAKISAVLARWLCH